MTTTTRMRATAAITMDIVATATSTFTAPALKTATVVSTIARAQPVADSN